MIDLHADQIRVSSISCRQHLRYTSVLADLRQQHMITSMVVSPDALGGVVRARAVANS